MRLLMNAPKVNSPPCSNGKRPAYRALITVLAVLSVTACAQRARLYGPVAGGHAQATEDVCSKAGGAEGYYQWITGVCMPEIERDLPWIIESAGAAAEAYVQDGSTISGMGEPGFVSEALGRAGGLIALGFGSPVDKTPKRGGGGPRRVVLYCIREESLDNDLAEINALHEKGACVIAFGREEFIDVAARRRVKAAAFVNSHAARDGGLFIGADGRFVVPTDPVANLIALWTWTGEFVAACTRLGKMPVMYKAYGSPGGYDWAKKHRSKKFHEAEPTPVRSGEFGRAFLSGLARSLDGIRTTEFADIRQAAELASDARLAGKKVYVFVHGHAIKDRMGCPHDPGYFTQYNEGWFDPRPGVELKSGDFLMYIGHGGMPTWGKFDKHNYLVAWREAGVKMVWSFGDMNHESFESSVGRIRDDEIFIDQHMYQGDACVPVPGHPIDIIPTSGVTSEAVLWMVNAEYHRLLNDSRLDTISP